jgi:hypothetical protein
VAENGEGPTVMASIEYEYDAEGKVIREGETIFEYAYNEKRNLVESYTIDGEAVMVEYMLVCLPDGMPEWMGERRP